MSADHFIGIEKFEADLWKLADSLRANSNLASNEYFMPIMGLIFLRHATTRFYEARAAIEADKAAGRMPNRPLVEADFQRRRALMMPDNACFDALLKQKKDGSLGAALTAAMESVEAAFPPLAGQLPKDYERFEDDVLEGMLRMTPRNSAIPCVSVLRAPMTERSAAVASGAICMPSKSLAMLTSFGRLSAPDNVPFRRTTIALQVLSRNSLAAPMAAAGSLSR